jgi:murein DD-endopeptidase MepM/ murein hydrolase activator NlpD
MIAEMGASGDSLFPHLHYELRNGIGAKNVEGVPSYFSNFRRLLGSQTVVTKRGQVDTGDVVEQVGPRSISDHAVRARSGQIHDYRHG